MSIWWVSISVFVCGWNEFQMKTLYLDIFSGISGDMFIGAMIDLGVDAHQLEHELTKLKIDGYHLHVARKQKSNIEGVKFDVHLAHDHHDEHSHSHGHDHKHEHEEHHHGEEAHGHADDEAHAHEHSRNFSQIKELIGHSALSSWVREKAAAVFGRVAVAEGKIHGMAPDQVHFHEVGAIDSIIDIVGACVCLEMLGRPRVLAAPVVEGTGWVNCAHGRFPVPTTATLEILGGRGIALTQCDEPHELVTPTGAALLAEFVESFGPMRGLVASRVGYGLGTRDNKTRPNVLRAVLGEVSGEGAGEAHDWETDTVVVIETNLDDINAEVLGLFVERALATGALDVFQTPIQMKKNRPGVLLTVLCGAADADQLCAMILRETTAFGVRRTVADRRKLHREVVLVPTPLGEVQVKLGRLDGRIVQRSPEFESCRRVAERAGVPVKAVYEAALRATNL